MTSNSDKQAQAKAQARAKAHAKIQAKKQAAAGKNVAGDRRPLTSRSTGWAHKATELLAGTSITPNQVSIAGMVFAAVAAFLFYISMHTGGWSRAIPWFLAALACQLRLLCNLLDGMLAVEAKRGSADGAAWNEFTDRYSDILILVGMGYAIGQPILGWAAACFSVLTAYTRELSKAINMGADFVGPMAKPHRMAAVTAATVLGAIASIMMAHDSTVPVLILSIGLWVITLGTLGTAIRRTYRLIEKLNANE